MPRPSHSEANLPDPADLGHGANNEKVPGHWLLARLGKRVLRPGGVELTHRMLDGLDISAQDDVVEFAPGMGATARLTLARRPATYTAVERDETAAEIVRRFLSGDRHTCVVGQAEATGLKDASASIVYGEAMLTMQSAAAKDRIIGEATRLLRPGGKYGIHEMAVLPDDIGETLRREICDALRDAIHHAVEPLTPSGWRDLFSAHGLDVADPITAPMHLLEPRRLIQDEGIAGAARFAFNVLRDGQARQRVLAMRRVFRMYERNLGAVALVGTKRID